MCIYNHLHSAATIAANIRTTKSYLIHSLCIYLYLSRDVKQESVKILELSSPPPEEEECLEPQPQPKKSSGLTNNGQKTQEMAKEEEEEEEEDSRVNIVPALVKAFGLKFLVAILLKVVQDILKFVSPQILKLLIKYVQREEETKFKTGNDSKEWGN